MPNDEDGNPILGTKEEEKPYFLEEEEVIDKPCIPKPQQFYKHEPIKEVPKWSPKKSKPRLIGKAVCEFGDECMNVEKEHNDKYHHPPKKPHIAKRIDEFKKSIGMKI